MDAIECGIVKLPRVPVDDNVTTSPHLSTGISGQHSQRHAEERAGRRPRFQRAANPASVCTDALYSHYKRRFDSWKAVGDEVPPCFIVVCNNTSTSKLVYDYVSGYERRTGETSNMVPGHLPLFDNYDANSTRLSRPHTAQKGAPGRGTPARVRVRRAGGGSRTGTQRRAAQPARATFERILENAPESFTAAQLRVLLRAIVNLDPCTFANDLAEGIAGENDRRDAEEVLLSAIENTADEKLTRFALRLTLSGHVGIPREDEFDFLSEAEAIFAPPPQAPRLVIEDRGGKNRQVMRLQPRGGVDDQCEAGGM